MIKRTLRQLVHRRLISSPAVALVGSRQAGKTTLAKTFHGAYFDLEQAEERLRLDLEWDRLMQGRKLLILDEAQEWPEVFPRLRGAIDADRRRNGRFLILGSIAPHLMRNVSESLAGRLALCELSPLLVSELPAGNDDALWLRGGYPDGGVLGGSRFPHWQHDYLTLLAQRDLPKWGWTATPQTTMRLFRMLAASHGQIWNASDIGRSLGLSYHTINRYLDYLQDAFLTDRLQPFHGNVRKRLIKRPKIYWQDSGLLHALLRIGSMEDLLSQPWVGASWEGWVIQQILRLLKTHGQSYEASFLRTSDGSEIDLVVDVGKMRWAFEVKLTSAPDVHDIRRLRQLGEAIRCHRLVLVSRTQKAVEQGDVISTNLRRCLALLAHSLTISPPPP